MSHDPSSRDKPSGSGSEPPPAADKPKKKGGFFSSILGPRDSADFDDYKEKPTPPPLRTTPEPQPQPPAEPATQPEPEPKPVELEPVTSEPVAEEPVLADPVAPEPVTAEPTAEEASVAPEPAPEQVDAAAVGELAAEEPAEDAPEGETPEEEEPEKLGFFARLRAGLARTANRLAGGIMALFTQRVLDDEALEELEDLLLTSDLGVETASKLTSALAKDKFGRDVTGEEIRAHFADQIAEILRPVAQPLTIDRSHKPFVVLVVGVNGSGKTTTIGKIANTYAQPGGLRVILAAGDTFRAAAVEQLKIWGERTGCPVIARDTGADAAGLAFDALKIATERGDDLLLIDTAGRLQNRVELMAELEKIIRVLRKQDPTAPHAVLQVLDATVGQNAHNQVEVFREQAGVTGLALTKLDGTAKGGVVVALADRFGLPVHYVGVGEGVDDLRPFEADDFAKSLMGL